jgi:hypothetical protein
MARLNINIGTTANDRTGDPLRTAFEKVNTNFIELYTRTGDDIQIPALAGNTGRVLTTNGTTLSWEFGLSISDFGEGFSLTDTNKIVTNKLYSTNPTQPNQHYRLELDTNGVIRLPDGSIINGSTIRGIAGTSELNYTGITIGPNSNDAEKTWMWVDHANAYISTNNFANTWTFGNNGTLTLPSGATQTSTGSVNCQPEVDTVVFTSSQEGIQTIKLLLQVEGQEGVTGDADTQSCEMIVAKGFRGPTVAASVYGIVYTSVEPLATFTADWNPTLLRVEVTCQPTSLTNNVNVKIFATEITTSD